MPSRPATSFAVPGISCISPRAPAWETASGFISLSWRAMASASAGGTRPEASARSTIG